MKEVIFLGKYIAGVLVVCAMISAIICLPLLAGMRYSYVSYSSYPTHNPVKPLKQSLALSNTLAPFSRIQKPKSTPIITKQVIITPIITQKPTSIPLPVLDKYLSTQTITSNPTTSNIITIKPTKTPRSTNTPKLTVTPSPISTSKFGPEIIYLGQEFIYSDNLGSFSVTITNVRKIPKEDLNQYLVTSNTKHGIFIEYSYTNISYETDVFVGFGNFTINDETGKSGKWTALSVTGANATKYDYKTSDFIGIGMTCDSTIVCQVDNESDEITLYKKAISPTYGNSAIFKLPVKSY